VSKELGDRHTLAGASRLHKPCAADDLARVLATAGVIGGR